MSEPSPIEFVHDERSEYFAAHRKFLVEFRCPECGHVTRAEVSPPPVSKSDWTGPDPRDIADVDRRNQAATGAAMRAYSAHRCQPSATRRQR